MTERIGMEKTAIIQSTTYSVRAMLHGQETVFAARDILNACGIKYPDKWMKRNGDRCKAMKLQYPMMTGCGCRRIKMFFVGTAGARKMVMETSCQQETRRWLLDEVLAYKIEEAAQEDEVVLDAAPITGERYLDGLGMLVDKALIELVEIKKYIVGARAAG